jgi:hypothetical protein
LSGWLLKALVVPLTPTCDADTAGLYGLQLLL